MIASCSAKTFAGGAVEILWVVVFVGAVEIGGFSPFRLGALRSLSRSFSFSFSLSAGSGGIILRLPLTTLPTVPVVLPFAPVAVRAGLDSRSFLVVTIGADSVVVRVLRVVGA
jgi:hypothetical protein